MDILNILGDLNPNQAKWLEASLPVVLAEAVAKAKENERAFEEVIEKFTAKPDVVEALCSKFVLPDEDGSTDGYQPTEAASCGETFSPR